MFQARWNCPLPAPTWSSTAKGCSIVHACIAVALRTVSPAGSETVRFMVAVIASYGLTLAFDRFTLTRSIFLGAAHRATPVSETSPARPARPAAPTGPA